MESTGIQKGRALSAFFVSPATFCTMRNYILYFKYYKLIRPQLQFSILNVQIILIQIISYQFFSFFFFPFNFTFLLKLPAFLS